MRRGSHLLLADESCERALRLLREISHSTHLGAKIEVPGGYQGEPGTLRLLVKLKVVNVDAPCRKGDNKMISEHIETKDTPLQGSFEHHVSLVEVFRPRKSAKQLLRVPLAGAGTNDIVAPPDQTAHTKGLLLALVAKESPSPQSL